MAEKAREAARAKVAAESRARADEEAVRRVVRGTAVQDDEG